MKYNIIIIICLFLLSCNRIYDGYVVKKEYSEAKTVESICMIGFNYVPCSSYHPECYEVIIKKTVKGKLRLNSFCVRKSIYNELKVGDYYNHKLYSREY